MSDVNNVNSKNDGNRDFQLVFDVGCHKGEFAFACLNRFPQCTVVALDASYRNFHHLQRYASRNLKVLHRVVSDTDDVETNFFISTAHSKVGTASRDYIQKSRFTKGNKDLHARFVQWDRTEKVPSITLDTLIEKYGKPQLIKIDTEGYEHEVLRGLSQTVEHVLFEWHEEDPHKVHKCIEHLKSIGYKEFGIIGNFVEGDVFDMATYSRTGDPFMEFPDIYASWSDLKFDSLCMEGRRVNFGMIYGRS